MEHFKDYLDLYKHPHDRQLFELRQIEEIVKGISQLDPVVGKVLDIALKAALNAWELKRRYSNQKQRHGKIDLHPLHRKLDKALAHLYATINAWMGIEDSQAEILRQACFPTGLSDLVHMSFVEQTEETHRRMSLVREKHWSVVEALHLQKFIENVEKCNKTLANAIEANQQDPVTYDQVQAAKAVSDEWLKRFVVVVLGHYPYNTPEDQEIRRKILTPILLQNQALRAEYKRSRRNNSEQDSGEEHSPLIDPTKDLQTV